MKLLGFVGSLRQGSYNKMLMRAAVAALPPGVEMEIAEYGDLPLFNQDLEVNFPPAAAALKEKIKAADGIVIVTPEFNRSLPGAFKNMLDWTSRPDGESAWPGKKVYTMGASSGNLGTALAQYDLKRILGYFGCRVMTTPEFHLNYTDKFDAQGNLTDEKTRERVQKAMVMFAEFCK